MKRFLTLLLFAGLLAAALLGSEAFARENLLTTEELYQTHELNSGPSYEALQEYVDMDALRAHLDQQLQGCSQKIDVRDYEIPLTLVNQLGFYIYKDIPEAFHVSGMSYSYYPGSDYIAELTVRYNLDQDEYDRILKQCADVAATMTAGLDDPDLSDAEKALILHDRLAVRNEYDLSLEAPNTHDIVGALINCTSVCEGYAKAYSYLLDQVGIRNYYVTSDLLHHGWNIVYIDGEKYHVDVTWDDPVNDRTGRVTHTNFLRSTQGMISTDHQANGYYDFDNTPQDTRYDDAFWQNVDTSFQLIGGKLYCITAGQLMQAQITGETTPLLDVSDFWRTSKGNWGNKFHCLASDGQNLLYSMSDKVYCYDIKTGDAEVIWEPDLPDGFAIFGFAYIDGYLVCDLNDSPNFAQNTKELYQVKKEYTPVVHKHTYDDACDGDCNICGEIRTPPHLYDSAQDLICNLCGYERPSYVLGDLDGIPGVDMDDAIYLLFYTSFPEYYPINQPCDFDKNGEVDMDDAIYLLFYISFPSDYPLSAL